MKILYELIVTGSLIALIAKWRLLPRRILATLLPVIGLALIQVGLTETGMITRSNLPVFIHLYYIIIYPVFVFYFYQSLEHRGWKRLFLYSIPVYYLAMLGGILFIPGYWNTNYTPEIQLVGLMVIMGTIRIFYQFYSDKYMVSLRRNPDFWIGLGNIIYYPTFSIALAGYWYYAYALEDHETGFYLLKISYMINISLYFIYTIAFLCPRKAAKSLSY